MNKEPKEVDWSKQKPGTIGATRDGNHYEFIAAKTKSVFWNAVVGFSVRHNDGRMWDYGEASDSDILLPWDFCIAEGHNPEGLTNAQVGEGFRLLASSEMVRYPIQWWAKDKWERVPDGCEFKVCDKSIGTYRVPITKLKHRIPCGPEHFPPGTVLRSPKTGVSWQAIAKVRNDDIITFTAEGSMMDVNYSSLQLEGIERSIDGGKTWLPCYVETEE